MMITPYWEHFEHKADIGVRGYGNTMGQAFEQAARALCAVVTELDKVENTFCVSIECRAEDQEVLLVDWLNELIFQMSAHHSIFSTFEVSIREGLLQARACGDQVDPQRHTPAVEVKGATFTEVSVRQIEDQAWLAQCVVDV